MAGGAKSTLISWMIRNFESYGLAFSHVDIRLGGTFCELAVQASEWVLDNFVEEIEIPAGTSAGSAGAGTRKSQMVPELYQVVVISGLNECVDKDVTASPGEQSTYRVRKAWDEAEGKEVAFHSMLKDHCNILRDCSAGTANMTIVLGSDSAAWGLSPEFDALYDEMRDFLRAGELAPIVMHGRELTRAMSADAYKCNAKWQNTFYVDHWHCNQIVGAFQQHAMAFCNMMELAARQQSMKVRADLSEMGMKAVELEAGLVRIPKMCVDQKVNVRDVARCYVRDLTSTIQSAGSAGALVSAGRCVTLQSDDPCLPTIMSHQGRSGKG